MMKGKKILLGVSGSIAAYKAVVLLRLLMKEGAEVRVIMTNGGTDFVTPLTFSTLSKNKVLTDLFAEGSWANHVALGRWADLMVIAPATCNTIAEMANGICDNLLQAVYLSATCPVLIAPAMDEDMWKHPSTIKNVATLESYGNHVMPVKNGDLASGLTGEGRMEEPEEILGWITRFFRGQKVLEGKHAVITAGPTYEALDPVRFIGNHSSGKMGIYIAEELLNRGAEVTLILGPSQIAPAPGIETIAVVSAEQMYEQAILKSKDADILIMAAAVADYRPQMAEKEKIKKTGESLTLVLEKTPDILAELGRRKLPQQLLVGFALETANEKENAKQKLQAKNADFIVLNSLRDEGAGFGTDTNKITIFDTKGNEFEFPLKSKKEAAADIIDVISRGMAL